mgnify:CR=1 FL=1
MSIAHSIFLVLIDKLSFKQSLQDISFEFGIYVLNYIVSIPVSDSILDHHPHHIHVYTLLDER